MTKHPSSEPQERAFFDLIDGKHPEDVRRLTQAETVLYYALPCIIAALFAAALWVGFHG